MLLRVVDLDDGRGVDLVLAHGADGVGLQVTEEAAVEGGEVAGGTGGPVGGDHLDAGEDAVGKPVPALGALEGGGGGGEGAVGAGGDGLLLLALGGLADDGLDLLPVGVGDLRAILRAHEHGGELEGGLAQASALTLDHRRREDGHDVRGELGDGVGDADEHAGPRLVVSLLDEDLDEHVAVQEQERVLKLARHGDALTLQVLVRVEEHLVCHLVVPQLLLLTRDDHGRARGLAVGAEGHVEAEDVVGVLGDAVVLAHEVVDERVRQHFVPRRPHHRDRLVERFLPHLQVHPQRLLVVVGLVEEVPRRLELLLALVVARHRQVLPARPRRSQEERERVYQLVRLRQLERLLLLLGDQQELERASEVGVGLTVVRALHGAFGRPCLPHDRKGSLRLAQMLQTQPDHLVHLLASLVGVRRLAVLPQLLLRLPEPHVQLRRVHQGHQSLRGLEVFDGDVQADRALVHLPFLVEQRRLPQLLHVRQDLRALRADALPTLDGELDAFGNVAHPQFHLRYAHPARRLVLLRQPHLHVSPCHREPLLTRLFVPHVRSLVLPLRLQLLGELQADVRDARGRERLSKPHRAVPLAEVAAHVEGVDGAGGGKVELLRERVVLHQQRDLARQQQLVLMPRQLLERHDVGAVLEVSADVEGDLDLEQLEGRRVELLPLAPLPEGHGVLEGFREAPESERLSELGSGGGEEVVGVETAVRVEDKARDGPHAGLMRQHAVDQEHGREVAGTLRLPDLVDPRALEGGGEELVRDDAAVSHRCKHAVLLHVPEHARRLGGEVGDLEHGGLDGVVDEALERGVDDDQAGPQLVGAEELDALRVPEVAGASLILEGEVDESSLDGRVDEKVVGQLHARDLRLVARLREAPRELPLLIPDDLLQVHLTVVKHGHHVPVQAHRLHAREVVHLPQQLPLLVARVEPADVVLAQPHVSLPYRHEVGLILDLDPRALPSALVERVLHPHLPQAAHVRVARAMCRVHHGHAGQEVDHSPVGQGHGEEIAVSRPGDLIAVDVEL
mmetsp:Transcript_13416/g.30901  ORF Transcript_13416/g.30901 Transcript_13416/m.30901 type:complete len:1019 (-) Transcript_13416:977-4033(-)|eukprot:761735-Hanusia_phi.AAC.3